MRDVTKILSSADLLKLKALLDQTPSGPVDPNAFEEYPKMLYAPDWFDHWRLMMNADPVIAKEARMQIGARQVFVYNIDEEEEFLADKWRGDPNTFIIEFNIAHGSTRPDPRVPVGREGRLASAHAKLSREQELQQVQRLIERALQEWLACWYLAQLTLGQSGYLDRKFQRMTTRLN